MLLSGRHDGKAALPELHFELEAMLLGMDSFAIYYRRETGARVAEMTVVNRDEKAVLVRVHYTA